MQCFYLVLFIHSLLYPQTLITHICSMFERGRCTVAQAFRFMYNMHNTLVDLCIFSFKLECSNVFVCDSVGLRERPVPTVIYMHKIDLIMAMSGVFTLYSLTCWSMRKISHLFIYGENDRKIVEITQFMFISFHLLAA